MPQDRFFLDAPFVENQMVTLTNDLHHLRVMRIKEGQTIELVNGQNALAQGRIEKLSSKDAQVTLLKVYSFPAPKKSFTLALAFCETNKLDLVIEKCTEIGATEFLLFCAAKSPRQEINTHQFQRLQAILISAMKQCGRFDLPKLSLKPSLSNWKKTDFALASYFGKMDAPHFQSPESHDLQFFIGPPSGFTPSEEEFLQENGAKGVSIAPYTLRSETAAIVATTKIINY